jgi:signal transduction histidine kinase
MFFRIPSLSVSRLFLGLLGLAFSVFLIFAVRLTSQFAVFSREAARLTENIRETTSLTLQIHSVLEEQTSLVNRQFQELESNFPEEFATFNFMIGDQQTRYLKLDISPEERLSVERVKATQSEMAVIGNQTYAFLKANDRPRANQRLEAIKALEKSIDSEFANLNQLQLDKLRLVQDELARTVTAAYRAIFGLVGGAILSLVVFVWFLRRRVLYPLAGILVMASRIREGDFTARAEVLRNDEIGELGHGINFMAESLAESYSDLEKKVEQRTHQLKELQQQLVQEAKMSAVGKLVSGVAHELNNPLAVIMGFTELAKRRLVATNGDPKEIKLMTDLHSQGDRCRKIVANLLQFSRQVKPSLEIVQINDLLDAALSLRAYELGTRNIEVVRDFDPANPMLLADPDKIKQIALNLINNAADAVVSRTEDGKLWIRTWRQDGKVFFDISDNGHGILDPERVFDPFYTTKEVGQGTGLGLSVCYGIVEEHGGEIRAENWEQGARFTVELPTGDISAAQTNREFDPPAKSLISRSALVVDDEETLLELQGSFLLDLGIESHGVGSGEAAIRFLESQEVDVIISDVRMPGSIDGLKLYDWVSRNKPELVDRFIFVSGDMIGMNVGEFFEKSSVARIQKPFTFDDYSQLVFSVLADKRSRV